MYGSGGVLSPHSEPWGRQVDRPKDASRWLRLVRRVSGEGLSRCLASLRRAGRAVEWRTQGSCLEPCEIQEDIGRQDVLPDLDRRVALVQGDRSRRTHP